ncbi:MAG: tyrosine recombinase [Candidatus Cloacimonadota bacterium]|nr:MAG: tyrosine recombinase [Candidatus Cloacimonadota bacterium]PIE78622.1 MAG: tyrosine recombinase [Candidatus Delongbacteria bacterium]
MLKQKNNLINSYLTYLTIEKGLSKNSIQSYENDIIHFFEYCKQEDISLSEVSQSFCEKYIALLDDLSYKKRSLSRKISSLKNFYTFLKKSQKVKENPFLHFKSYSFDNGDREILTIEEVDKLFGSLDKNKLLDIRNFVIMELMYSCGLRVSEVIDLKIDKINLDDMLILIKGKGNKQRFVPFGKSTKDIFSEYIKNFRLLLLNENSDNYLILNRRGKPLSRMGIWKIVRKSLKNAGLSKKFHPHSLRHSYATHLIEGGADIRSIQLLLGHEDISTTQIYINISKTHLKEIHKQFHPRG